MMVDPDAGLLRIALTVQEFDNVKKTLYRQQSTFQEMDLAVQGSPSPDQLGSSKNIRLSISISPPNIIVSADSILYVEVMIEI